MASSQRAGAGCLVVFGLIFVVLGSIPGCIALHDMDTAAATADWRETRATLLDVRLVESDDTMRVEASYRYRAADPEALEEGAERDYEGSQVGIHTGSDNIGDWHAETFARLDAARQAGQEVPCWYDPADPATAVLDRSERWELVGFMFIFPLVFGLVGGGIAVAGVAQLIRGRRRLPSAAEAAQQRSIPADGGAGCVLWVVAIVWNAISWAAVGGAFLSGDVPPLLLLPFALFPLIGIALLWGAALGTLRRMRHGRPVLRLDQGRWTGGTRIQATVLARTAPQPGDRIAARLQVLRCITTGSGKNRSTTEQPLWVLDLPVEAGNGRAEGGSWAVPVDMPLPGDLPPAQDDVIWRLEWQLIRPGPDLSATFTLPVEAGDAGALPAAGLLAEADRAAPLAVLARAGIAVADEAGRMRIVLPPFRNPSLYATGLVCCLFLSVGAWALWTQVGWWTGLLSLPLLGLCWRGALRSALWRSAIAVSRERIVVQHGWWRMHEADVAMRDLIEVARSSSMSSGTTAWFNMWLVTADGARIPIARGVPAPAAGRIADLIDRARR